MSVLTDDEIYTMYSEPSSDAEMVAFAREVESAVIAKLAQGVSVEPDSYKVETEDNQFFTEFEADTVDPATNDDAVVTPLYTADAIAAARVQENERCAKVAECYGPSRPIVTIAPSPQIKGRWEGEQAASGGIANAIRALIGKEST